VSMRNFWSEWGTTAAYVAFFGVFSIFWVATFIVATFSGFAWAVFPKESPMIDIIRYALLAHILISVVVAWRLRRADGLGVPLLHFQLGALATLWAISHPLLSLSLGGTALGREITGVVEPLAHQVILYILSLIGVSVSASAIYLQYRASSKPPVSQPVPQSREEPDGDHHDDFYESIGLGSLEKPEPKKDADNTESMSPAVEPNGRFRKFGPDKVSEPASKGPIWREEEKLPDPF